MANNDLKVDNKSIADGQKKNQNPFFSFFNNFNLNFPQFNKQPKQLSMESTTKKVESKSPDFVRVQGARKDFPSVKLEGEEFEEANSGPQNMWQVYALGTFMIGRWLWARWNERKADQSRDCNEQPPPSETS
ncbi:hypothetical protein ACHQM5_009891 [Ranunculus cassubicifolius]